MSREVLDILAEARPEELDPGVRVDAGTRRRELAAAMAAPRETGRTRRTGRRGARRTFVRPAFGLGLAGVAAATAVVIGIAGTGGNAPEGGSTTRLAQPRDARTVLLAAAESADRQADVVGRYWYTSTVTRHYFQVGEPGDRYTIAAKERGEGWVPAEPGDRVWGRSQEIGAVPVSQADEAAWRRAGSPTTFDVRVPVAPGHKVGKPLRLTLKPQPPETTSGEQTGGDEIFWLGRNVTMQDLRALPSDPGALKKDLLRWYEGHGTESDTPATADVWLFDTARGLITDMPVTPQVRAAAFRMLASLDTVDTIGKVRDAEGRTGTAVAMTSKTDNGVFQERVIIDEAGGRALGADTILLKPAGNTAHLPARWTYVSSAHLTTEWTDQAPN